MGAHRESAWDRRTWLVTVTRGTAAAGVLTAGATLLARGGLGRGSAPCGIARECSRCGRLAGCPARPGNEPPPDRQEA